MQNFYLTFGQKSPAKNGYIVVKAESETAAREIVICAYGLDWCFLHNQAKWDKEDYQRFFPVGQLGELS